MKHTENLLIDTTDLGTKNARSGFYTICDKRKRIIAYVKMGAFPDEKTLNDLSLDEGEANLKLFRGSPKLLELAYQFSIVMNQLSGRMGEQMEIEVNKMIEEAIEKAT